MKKILISTPLLFLAFINYGQFNTASYNDNLNTIKLSLPKEKYNEYFEGEKFRNNDSISESKKKKEYKKNNKKNKIKKVAMPLEHLEITSNYGVRTDPFSGKKKFHYGLDLRADYERIYAVFEGEVEEVGYNAKSGYFIKIKHPKDYKTIYLHLSTAYVKEGSQVKAGDIIGKTGDTGSSTAPHLHFAVKEDGVCINPIYFLTQLRELNNISYNGK